MQHINRLLIRAKRAAQGTDFCFAIGFVDYDEDSGAYIAKPQPWDGKPGSGTEAVDFPEWWHNDWQTEDEASEALHRLFIGYGIPEDNCVIFLRHYV